MSSPRGFCIPARGLGETHPASRPSPTAHTGGCHPAPVPATISSVVPPQPGLQVLGEAAHRSFTSWPGRGLWIFGVEIAFLLRWVSVSKRWQFSFQEQKWKLRGKKSLWTASKQETKKALGPSVWAITPEEQQRIP